MNRGRIVTWRVFEHGADNACFSITATRDSVSLVKLLYSLQPDEIYNLAHQSHVRVSFDILSTRPTSPAWEAARILEAIIESGIGKKVRYYQASLF